MNTEATITEAAAQDAAAEAPDAGEPTLADGTPILPPPPKPKRKRAPARWQTIKVDGKTVKVAVSLSPAEAEAAARKLVAARAPKTESVVAKKPARKTPRVVKLEVAPRKNGTVRIYPRPRHYDAIRSAKEWQQEHKAAWKAVKAGKRIEQKNGLVYYSVLLASQEDADAVLKLLASA